MNAPSDPPISWPRRVVGLFLERFGRAAEPSPDRHLDRLPYSLHLTTATGSVELFPEGPLDVFRFYQRHHASLHHEVEYIACRPGPDAPPPPEDPESCHACGQDLPEDQQGLLAYAVLRLNEVEETPFSDLNALEDRLQLDYGHFFHLPRARPLLEKQYGEDLNDEDPPEGPNRVVVPEGEPTAKGRLNVAETLAAMRTDLAGHELVSWLEAAFRQRPPEGEVEHRYYLDDGGQVYLVRDHFREGKTLYKAETSPEVIGPIRAR